LEGLNATVEDVLNSVKDASCVHFACHGYQDRSSCLESALLMHDGPLRLSAIASNRLAQADFAFLSACHSARGSDDSPDEAMHIAAGMQAAGFRSIIATMWAISDQAASAGPF
jgi:CHAT domain-containing protein